MPKTILYTFFLVFYSVTSIAQATQSSLTGNTSQSQKKLQDLLDRLSSLPPEYKADLGFLIVDTAGNSLSPAQRRSLLEEIFHSAVKAHYPSGLTDASAKIHSNMRVGLLENTKLDTLDIQSGAIERALPKTPELAGELFEELKLSEGRASCNEPEVVDLSAFYKLTAKLIADRRIKSVSGEEKDMYILTLITKLNIVSEIAPLAELISNSSVPDDQMGQYETAFTAALNRITASDREMTAVEEGGRLTNAIKELTTKFANAGIAPERLLIAYRGFLVRSLTPESCADYSLDRAEIVQNFNEILPNPLPSSTDLAPLTVIEISSRTMGASAPRQKYTYDEKVNNELFRIAAAHTKQSTEELSSGQPGTTLSESADIDDVISYATSLEPGGAECSACDFMEKVSLLNVLVQIVPPGHQLEKVVYAQIDYLAFNEMQKESPVAWLPIFKHLLNASRRLDDRAKDTLTAKALKGNLMPLDTPSAAAQQIHRILSQSADPIISTYMSADDLLHIPYSVGEHF